MTDIFPKAADVEPSFGRAAHAPGAFRDDHSVPSVTEDQLTFRKGVRESMAQLPVIVQPALSYITGKPLAGQKPIIALHPLTHTLMNLVMLAAIPAITMWLLARGSVIGVVALPAALVVITGLLRRLQVVYAHHASHDALGRSRRENYILAEVLTTIALIQNGADYRRTHKGHHNKSDFSTHRDIGAQVLLLFGFAPGMSKQQLWRHFWVSILSPSFHWKFLRLRFRSNFITVSPYRRAMAAVWLAVLATIALSVPFWIFAIVILLPLIPLYHVSTLLNTLTEHAWMVTEAGPVDIEDYANRCWGRFCGDPCPGPAQRGAVRVAAWTRWWFRLLLVHLPVRLSVMVGDTPAHDWHHLCGYGNQRYDWPNAIYRRQEAIAAGKGKGMDQREIWGLGSAIDHVFAGVAGDANLSPTGR